jgi:hypothetical protein
MMRAILPLVLGAILASVPASAKHKNRYCDRGYGRVVYAKPLPPGQAKKYWRGYYAQPVIVAPAPVMVVPPPPPYYPPRDYAPPGLGVSFVWSR